MKKVPMKRLMINHSEVYVSLIVVFAVVILLWQNLAMI